MLFVLHHFLLTLSNLLYIKAFLLLFVFYISLIRPNKIKAGCGLLKCDRLLCGTESKFLEP